MNSVVIVNWEDKVFVDRVRYSLEKQGFVREEDYESTGLRTQVWTKSPKENLAGRMIGSDPLEAIRLIPVESLVSCLMPRLAVLMPEGTSQADLEWSAKNLAFDLMGKPG